MANDLLASVIVAAQSLLDPSRLIAAIRKTEGEASKNALVSARAQVNKIEAERAEVLKRPVFLLTSICLLLSLNFVFIHNQHCFFSLYIILLVIYHSVLFHSSHSIRSLSSYWSTAPPGPKLISSTALTCSKRAYSTACHSIKRKTTGCSWTMTATGW